jgi:hypothetical protein
MNNRFSSLLNNTPPLPSATGNARGEENPSTAAGGGSAGTSSSSGTNDRSLIRRVQNTIRQKVETHAIKGELSPLLKQWNIQLDLSKLSLQDMQELITALRTLPIEDEIIKDQKGKQNSNSDLVDLVQSGLASGQQDWIETYQTLARLKLIDPNKIDRNRLQDDHYAHFLQQVLEQPDIGSETEKQSIKDALLPLLKQWNIKLTDAKLNTLKDLQDLTTALRTFAKKDPNSGLADCLADCVHTGFASGRRDWIDAYKTLVRLNLIDPNMVLDLHTFNLDEVQDEAEDDDYECLLQQVLVQPEIRSDWFTPEENAVNSEKAPYLPAQRLKILIDSGVTLEGSNLDAATALELTSDSDRVDILKQLPGVEQEIWAQGRVAWLQAKEYKQWAAEGSSLENRNEAVNRMEAWVNNNQLDVPLDLSGLNLRDLTEHLPPGLKWLNVSQNQLSSLPENLPASLQGLIAFNNRLASLPETLPAGLRQILAYNNRLTRLPKLPDGIEVLNVSWNQLTSLPKLPDGIKELNVSRNQLTSLPKLPDGIKELNVSRNQLTRLPELRATLTALVANSNKLTSLPDQIETTLGPNCKVILPNNSIPDSLRNTLQASANTEGYNGPVFIF